MSKTPEMSKISEWKLVFAPWVEGKQEFPYLCPPQLKFCGPGCTILVEGPKGLPKLLKVSREESLDFLPPFPCKPIACAWTQEAWETLEAAKVQVGPHEDFPLWKVQASQICNGEEPCHATDHD